MAETGMVAVFGVGGAGGNAVAPLLDRPAIGMKVICANTDMQALRMVPPAHRLQLGRLLTAGLGAGARPDIGRAAAQEALPAIRRALDGASLCFVAAGMGGGTGSGAAPVIARTAREMGILTIGVATRPFAFEGRKRQATADAALAELRGTVDALVTVCNQNLFRVIGAGTTLAAALALSDSIIRDSAADFALLLRAPSLKTLTLADLRAMLAGSGDAMVGYGERGGSGDRALAAARAAFDCPLLDGRGAQARHLLVTIAGGDDLGLFEIEDAMAWLRGRVPAATDIVWGAVIDPALAGRVRVGVVAGGLTPDLVVAASAPPADIEPPPAMLCVADASAVDGPGLPEPLGWPPDPEEAVAPMPERLPAADGRPAPVQRDRIRGRTARPSLAERLYDAACDLTRRPVLVAIPEPTPRTPPVFRLVKAFAPHPLHRAA